jgi:hypothetical protein
VIFDNSKIKRLAPGWAAKVPFAEGARQMIDWFGSHPDRQVVDKDVDAAFDTLVERFGGVPATA